MSERSALGVDLREPVTADAAMIATWERHPENEAFIVAWDVARHRAGFEDPDLRYFILVHDGDAVGFALLAGLTDPHRAVEFRRLVVVEKGRGYGRAAVEAVKRYCFGVLGAHRLWLDVLEQNARARSLYESAGFVPEGVLRECIMRQDGFQSLVVMSILESEYVPGRRGR